MTTLGDAVHGREDREVNAGAALGWVVDDAKRARSQPLPHKEFRPDIEGIRAIAVVSVVLFHAGVPGLDGGFVGVDVFFVISGFLITGMLWRQARTSGTVRLREFYGARARRLLPASALVGVVTMIASAMLLSPLQVKTTSIDAITSALYVSNYWFISNGCNYFRKDNLLTPSPFQHYWSLGVEEQFYLLWPILIIVTAWLVRRVRRLSTEPEAASVRPYVVVLALVAIVSFALSLVITYVIPPIAYFSLPTRAWELAAGGLIALTAGLWRRLPSKPAALAGWTGVALIGLACLGLSPATSYPGVAALLPTAGAALIIGAGCAGPSRGCGRALGLSPMRWIGRVSYSWYLWHWPVLVLTPALLGRAMGWPTTTVAVAVSLGLAVLTSRYVENPLRFSDRIRLRPRNSLALGAAATAIAVVVGVVPLLVAQDPVGHGPAATPLIIRVAPVPPGSGIAAYDDAVQQALAQVQSAVVAGLEPKAVPSNLTPALGGSTDQIASMLTNGCLLVGFQSAQPECVAGDRESPTTVALIGDSHAAMFNPAFEMLAVQRGWRLEMLSKAACPIVGLPLTAHFNAVAEAVERCAQWRDQIFARLRAERPQLIVVSSAASYGPDGSGIWGQQGFDSYNSGWVGGLADLVRQLRENGSQVLVLGATPGPRSTPSTCLSGHLDDVTACAYPWPAEFNKGMTTQARAIESAGGQFADLTEVLCSDGRCPVIVGNTLVFCDGGHLTREYSEILAPLMGALADRARALG
jgi:peptidoglycan/LPS O-acetylase OafA/YrhL